MTGEYSIQLSRPTKYRALVAFALAVLLATATAFTIYVVMPLQRIGHYNAGFREIAIGDFQEDVIARLGDPDRVRTGEQMYTAVPDKTEDYVGKQEKCEKQFAYDVDTFFLPITWVIGFDDSGHVVTKFKLD